VRGEPGDQWLLFASSAQVNATPLPGIMGSLFIDPAVAFQLLGGTIGPTGGSSFSGNYTNPGFPVMIHAQVLFIDQQAGLWLSGPGSLVSW
jgi:hypothetical protein